MPPTSSPQGPAKRSREKQDPDIAKRLNHGPYIKALKNLETACYESERAREKAQDDKFKDQDTKAEIKDLNAQISQVTEKLSVERGEKVKLSRLNNELKIELLKLQPQSQLTDSQIAGQYTKLRQNVSSWLDTEVKYYEDQWKAQNGGVYPKFNVLRDGSAPGHAKFLEAGHIYARQYLVESYVLHQIHRLLFDLSKKFFAFDGSEETLIGSVEEGLSKLDPPRGKLIADSGYHWRANLMFVDPSVVRYLRSEILKGFVKSDDFQIRRAEWMAGKGSDLLKRTATMLPEISKEDQQRRVDTFRSRVLGPAFDLAVAIQTSATVYGFSEPLTQEARFKWYPLRHHSSDSCTMINIDTRLEMKVNQPANSNHDGVIAYQVLLICPGLVRYDGRGAKRLTDDIVCAKFPSPAAKVSPILHQDQQKSATDSNGRAFATPKKKRKIEKDGQTHSSPIDVEEPVKTEKEDT